MENWQSGPIPSAISLPVVNNLPCSLLKRRYHAPMLAQSLVLCQSRQNVRLSQTQGHPLVFIFISDDQVFNLSPVRISPSMILETHLISPEQSISLLPLRPFPNRKELLYTPFPDLIRVFLRLGPVEGGSKCSTIIKPLALSFTVYQLRLGKENSQQAHLDAPVHQSACPSLAISQAASRASGWSARMQSRSENGWRGMHHNVGPFSFEVPECFQDALGVILVPEGTSPGTSTLARHPSFAFQCTIS
jgi:hypothetical protein